VSATIYVEGGGDTELSLRKCREGFSEYCEKVVSRKRRFRIVACGARSKTYANFITAGRRVATGDACVLLVDSEGPVQAGATPKDHLQSRDGWEFNNAASQQIFLMVQAMEAWLLADRNTLAKFYGSGFRPNRLPGTEQHIEGIRKEDLEPALINATRDTKTKGKYDKIGHGMVLIGQIDPLKVSASSPHAAAFHNFLRSL
jgi:hypothetical protein